MAAPTLTRSSPKTGTLLPQGRPFWIVDGQAYDFTDWMNLHPGGATWFAQTQGRDISALLHTYHREPAGLQRMLAKYRIDGFSEKNLLPQLGVPPFLLAPNFDARTDLPKLDYGDAGTLLAEIRRRVSTRFSRQDLRRRDRAFDAVTCAIGGAHIATLALLIAGLLPAWAFVVITVLTRTALAGAGHYQVHRRWKQRRGRSLTLPMGKALFDINYVGTSLIGTDGHVLLHHPYLGSGADVKKTFFDSMLRLHPALRIPGYTLHKLGICLTGLSFRAWEIARFEQPERGKPPAQPGRPGPSRGDAARDQSGDRDASRAGKPKQQPRQQDASRVDFWLIRTLLLAELALCLATGHWLAWLVQFVVTLWVNTFLVVASHDFEEETTEEQLAAIPEALRNDWAAQQICTSYDLSVVGNRWIDLFLSAGLSPHRVHHVLPWQGSGFANLACEATVREVCEEAGIAWKRPRNLIFERFPAVIKHYMLCPAKAAPPRGDASMPPPGPGQPPKPLAPGSAEDRKPALPTQRPPQPLSERAFPGPPAPPDSQPEPPARSVIGQIGVLFSYTLDGFRGVGV